MNNIIDQFIDYIRHDMMEKSEPAQLNELIADVVSFEQVDGRNLIVNYGDDIELPMVYVAMKRVLANLIQNAFKYSDADVEIECGVERSKNIAYIKIADHGPGISENEMQRLFQPFTQGDTARGSQGSGLGLAIIKRIVDGHGGCVSLHNRDSGGLVAVVELPLN